MSKEFLDDYANRLLEVHAQPGEVFCWLDPERFKFKKIDPRIKSVEFRAIEGEPTKVMMVVHARDFEGVVLDEN